MDSAFNAGVDHEVLSLAIQPDGRIFIGGRFTSVNGSRRPAAARLNLDGTLDPTFDPTGIDSGIVRSIVIQPDGKIMFCGLIFTPLSPTFRTGILRINSNGTTDTSFSIDAASDYVNSVSLLADGRIYVGGSFTNLAGSGRNRVARLNSNGTVDSSFISGIGPNAEVRTISQQPDGKLLIGGDFTNVQGVSANRIARLNADGTVDPTFNTGLGFSATVLDIQIQPDGQGSFSILVGGFFTRYNGTNRTGFARLGANGSLSSFAENIAYVYKMAIQTDGKILVGGEFTNAGGQPHKAIVRLNVSADDPCFATPITFGQTFSGTFSSGSCVVNNDRVDIYSFSAVTGQQIALTIYSGNTAVGVKLLSPQGPIIAGDFNPSGAESIRIPGAGYFTLPASGTYLVHAISRSASNTGDYTLSLYRAPETTVCTYSLSPREINAPSTGGSFFFDVLTQPGCPPPTQPAASGTVYNGLSYIGGRVAFTVIPNPGGARQETISIAGQTHTINQFGIFAPTNDPFINAQVLNGSTNPVGGPVTGHNTNATAESGEPSHAGSAPATSVWYNWTPPTDGSGLYTFSTSGSSFNTVMAIYACPTTGGCTLSNLIPVGSNDDTTSFDKTSKVNFNANVGTQYMIAVDGKNGATGTIELSWRPYKRLYRLYLQNYNGDASTFIPDSVRASNGSNIVIPTTVSRSVYEFNLPPDNSIYTVTITGPTGIVWDPNNLTLDTSFRVFDELMGGNRHSRHHL